MIKEILKLLGSILMTVLGTAGIILLVSVFVDFLPEGLGLFFKIILGFLFVLISMVVGAFIKIKSEDLV